MNVAGTGMEDYCTAEWKAQAWERAPEHFAEWAVDGGIDGTTRRQAREPAGEAG